MKKVYLSFLLILTYGFTYAQCLSPALSVANGNSSFGRAPSGSYMSIRCVYLITAAEMAAAGFVPSQVFSEIGWTYNTVPASAVTGNMNILLENTSDVTFTKSTTWATATASMTSHRNAPTTLPASSGQFSIPFTNSFTYNGGGVYVAFEWINCGAVIAAVTASCNTDLALGLRNITSATTCTPGATMTGSSAFRPLTAFGSAVPNDLKVKYIYNQGEMTIGKSSNLPFSASITNNSGTPLTNIPVTLAISGANTFTATSTIASIPACSTQVISLTTTYTPTNEGIDSVMVYLPPDANTMNDTLRIRSTVGKQKMAYRNIGENSSGGVGFTAGTGTIAIKFNAATAGIITHVDMNFGNVTVPSQYRLAIYGDNSGLPSATPLYSESVNRTNVSGNVLIKLDTPVPVPAGPFYLAIQQMSTDNLALGYSAESPLRTGSFYLSSNPPATWSDLGGGANTFKVISGVRFCHPFAPTAILGPIARCEGAGVEFSVDTNITPNATSYNWILPPGYVGYSSTDKIFVTIPATSDIVKVVANYPCGTSDTASLSFTATPLSNNNLALSNIGNTVSNAGTSTATEGHGDGLVVTYSDINCNPIALVADVPGGNILGNTVTTLTVDTSVKTINGQPYLRRHIKISPASNGPATVLLYISQADFNDYNTAAIGWPQLPTSGSNTDPNIANIRITKVNGTLGVGSSTVITPTVNWDNARAHWEIYFPVDSFSTFYVHAANPSNQALPVLWQSFNVSKQQSSGLLNWVTSNETNNSHFNIQHSTDGNHFETIGRVNTTALNGNSNTLNSYAFIHENPMPGFNYYRIEQIDRENNSSYSAVRELIWNQTGNVYNLYPQPANDLLNIEAVVQKTTGLTIELTDIMGKMIHFEKINAGKGTNLLNIDVSQISNGFYFVRILENNKVGFTQKVTIQH